MAIPIPPAHAPPPHAFPAMQPQFLPMGQHVPNPGRPLPAMNQQGLAGHADLPSRVRSSNTEPTYESYTFRKAESIDPQKKKTWARYTINETPIPEEELKKQVQKQQQKKISVYDQYHKLEPRRQTMIDSFIEEKKGQEKDKRFERKLASVTTEERKVGRLGYETVSINVILKRQLRPIVTTERVGGATVHQDISRDYNGPLPPRHHQEQAPPPHPAFETMNIRPNVANPAGLRNEPREQFGPMPPRPGPPAGTNHQGQPNFQQNRPQHPSMNVNGREPQITVVDDRIPPPPPLPQHPHAVQNGPPRQAPPHAAPPHAGLRHQPSQPQFQPAPPQQRPLSRNGNQFAVPQQQPMPQQRGGQPPGIPHQQPRPQSRNGNQFVVPQQQSIPPLRGGQSPVISQQPRPQSRHGDAPGPLPQHKRSQSRDEQRIHASRGMPRGPVPEGPQRKYSVHKPSAKQERVAQWLDSDEDVADSDELTEDGTVITEATDATSLDDELDFHIKEPSRRGSLHRHHSRPSHTDPAGRRGPQYREHRRRPTASSDPNGSISPRYPRGEFEVYPEVSRARHPPNARRQSFAATEVRPAFVHHPMSYDSSRYDARDLPRLTRGPSHRGFHQPPQRRLPEAPYSADFIDERQQRQMRDAQYQQELDHMEALRLEEMEAAEQWDRSRILDQDPRRFPNRGGLGSRRLSGGYFPSMGRHRFDFEH